LFVFLCRHGLILLLLVVGRKERDTYIEKHEQKGGSKRRDKRKEKKQGRKEKRAKISNKIKERK
jgi:hypothetical protein